MPPIAPPLPLVGDLAAWFDGATRLYTVEVQSFSGLEVES